MDIFKILAICFVAAILAVILKQHKAEYALIISLAAGILVMYFIFRGIFAPIELIKGKLTASGINSEYFKVALKALGIGYVTGFIADTCRDSGQTSLAAKAELAGKCAIFLLSVPLILSVLETALGLVQ